MTASQSAFTGSLGDLFSFRRPQVQRSWVVSPIKAAKDRPILNIEQVLQEKEVKMLSLWTKLTTLVKAEKGASMVEYALLVVLIAIIAIVAVSIAGQNVSAAFSTIAGSLGN